MSPTRRRIRTAVRAAVAAGVACGVLVQAQGFAVRTGTWQMTMTLKGAMPAAGLPPEVQAMLAEQFAKPQTFPTCVSEEDLKGLTLGRMPDDEDTCTPISSKVTATTADITRRCEGYVETGHFEASSAQAFTGTVSRKMPSGVMTMAVAATWTAAECTQ